MLGRIVRRIVRWYARRARKRRIKVFRGARPIAKSERVLDLGSEDGSHIATALPMHDNVTLADVSIEVLQSAREKHGFTRLVVIDEAAPLPFSDDAFDVVFCSSVIEHATVPKDTLGNYHSKRDFRRAAFRRQLQFAREIRRVGTGYFVQTPYKYFPIESHTWLPVVIVLLPRRIQSWILGWIGTFWPKTTMLDWNLLTVREMAMLFPDAQIVRERSLGLTKSIMAIKRGTSIKAGEGAQSNLNVPSQARSLNS